MIRILLFFLPVVAATVLIQCTQSKAGKQQVQAITIYEQQITHFAAASDSLLYHLEKSNPLQWQAAFKRARLAYKELEILADYYYPSTAKAINGPPVKEVEADDFFKEIEPTGFQVMEESLFPIVDTAAKEDLLIQARIIYSLAKRLQNGLTSLQLSNSHLMDALRLQLLRIISIGLAGGDNGIVQNSIVEAAVGLQSFQHYLSLFEPSHALTKNVEQAIAYLQQDTSFTSFNRANFIVQFARPLWNGLHQLQKEKGISFLKETGLVNASSPQLFDSLFFNATSFSNTGSEKMSPALVLMGKRLFSDNRLSGDKSRSCASCHNPQKGYADHLVKASSIDGKSVIFRNTPTIFYAALQPLQFADGRLSFLEDQAKAVIENHSEMKGNLRKISNLLSADTAYQQLATTAFGKAALNENGITSALAAFIRTQSPFRSSFDAYLNGDIKALSATAIKGFNLFMGKAKCGTCHFMPLFSGVVPPHFSRMESEVIGVPQKATAPFQIDGDEGRFRYTGASIHRFAFKTPTLRNVALTAPYMHNGIYQTLEEVIDFYDKGGAAGLNVSLSNQTLPADPLNLTRNEKREIIQFLQALTDQ